MLAAAKGAIVVTATREPDSGSHAVFRLEARERISDPRLLFRGKFVLGIERKFEERGWHDTLTFWRNRPAGSGEYPGNCEFGQFVDPASPHVLLLGVDGPYALEPISGENDRWYVLVKSYFAQKAPMKDIVVPMPDLLRRLRPESATGCRISDYDEKSVDVFLNCVRSNTGSREYRSPCRWMAESAATSSRTAASRLSRASSSWKNSARISGSRKRSR